MCMSVCVCVVCVLCVLAKYVLLGSAQRLNLSLPARPGGGQGRLFSHMLIKLGVRRGIKEDRIRAVCCPGSRSERRRQDRREEEDPQWMCTDKKSALKADTLSIFVLFFRSFFVCLSLCVFMSHL